jgi:hypothetical protein
MQVSVQTQAPAALPPGKECSRLDGPQIRFPRFEKDKISAGIRTTDRTVRSPAAIPNTLYKLLLTKLLFYAMVFKFHASAIDWKFRGSNPGEGEIFLTYPDRPWVPPSLLYNGYRFFPGGKERPGSDADPSPHSAYWT